MNKKDKAQLKAINKRVLSDWHNIANLGARSGLYTLKHYEKILRALTIVEKETNNILKIS